MVPSVTPPMHCHSPCGGKSSKMDELYKLENMYKAFYLFNATLLSSMELRANDITAIYVVCVPHSSHYFLIGVSAHRISALDVSVPFHQAGNTYLLHNVP